MTSRAILVNTASSCKENPSEFILPNSIPCLALTAARLVMIADES